MPTPTSICLGITELDIGGAEKNFVRLAVGLKQRGWRPLVVCLQPTGPLADPLQAADIEVHALGLTSPLQFFAGLRRWTDLLCRQRPALVQTFLFHANILGRLAARRAGVPIAVSGVRVAEKRTGWHARLDRWTRRWSTCHVCVSEAVRRFTIEQCRRNPEQTIVIPNGVDLAELDAIPPATETVADDRPLLVAIGRLERQKGFDVLLHALQKQPGCQLVLLGDGPDRLMLESLSGTLGLADRVRFLGWRPDAVGWIKRAEALVLASRWEGMPNVVLEALACRRPVIATQVEGVNELVAEGVTGWLAAPEDVASLADAIGRCLACPQREPLGQAGRLRIEQSFTTDIMIDAYEQLYHRLLQQSAAPTAVNPS